MEERIVDLHVHSRFARATSKAITVEGIYRECKIKGIDVVATGDYTHPVWFAELRENLEKAEEGLYRLREDKASLIDKSLPMSVRNNQVRFILSVEISNIYRRYDRTRRLHNLVILPDFEAVAEFNGQLSKIGNLKSDGRPILGLDSEKLLEIALKVSDRALFIPAHIWTPWFAMFGSKSGFDSIEEAFGDNAEHIYAIETGLSSDPFMNWRVKDLDRLTIVSGSDAHSLPKLAREANVMRCGLSYGEIVGGIKTGDGRFAGTVEFFPEEGMYHCDGHRKCRVSMYPSESAKYGKKCPKCKKDLVVGVVSRVADLAEKRRGEGYRPKKHKRVEYAIPLVEVIAEIVGVKSIKAKKVEEAYRQVYSSLGDDFHILREIGVGEIERAGFADLALAIKKIREEKVHIEPGYDGVYGVVQVFEKGERKQEDGQMRLV